MLNKFKGTHPRASRKSLTCFRVLLSIANVMYPVRISKVDNRVRARNGERKRKRERERRGLIFDRRYRHSQNNLSPRTVCAVALDLN